MQEYIDNLDNKPSLTKLAFKYKVNRKLISDRLKELGYKVINYQNVTKFNENIFDVIDTEEKAYWLGFIFADGYIDSSPLDPNKKSVYNFELSLKGNDTEHLNKFNIFMGYKGNNVKISDTYCTSQERVKCQRCRWLIANKHLWETLNSYGCVPKKSLILQFPDESIFKSTSLIKHFIRGYFDGDGCISYANRDHSSMEIDFLGTEDFLTGIKKHLPLKFDYVLGYNDKKKVLLPEFYLYMEKI